MILQKLILRGGVTLERGLHSLQLHLKRAGWQLIYNYGFATFFYFMKKTIFQYVAICSSTAWPARSNSKKARGSTSSWTCSNSRLQNSQRWVWMIILVWWYCEEWLWKDDPQVGEWTPQDGLVITDEYAFTEGRPPNITLRVRWPILWVSK